MLTAEKIPPRGHDKNAPQPAWIEHLRGRYTTEREVDAILTRRLGRRAGPGYAPQSLATLRAGVEALLRDELDEPFTVLDTRWLTGGASKVQMAFTLDWVEPGVGRTRTPMVLRMEPAESIVETSRLREFQLIRAMRGVVPVPPAYWVDADGSHLPYPALIYGFVPGATKPSTATSGVSGLGINFGPALRGPLASQFVEHLAAVHTFDFSGAQLGAFDVPQVGTQSVEWGLNWWARVWEEDCGEEVPLMNLAAHWMRQNMPPADRICVIHGDYRAGNYLFTEADARITALLDWELGRLGDRHQDLAYLATPVFGHLAEDGVTFLASGLLPPDELYEAYEKASGLTVDPRRLHFYKIYNAFFLAALTLGTGYRIARGGKTHQDVLVAWLIGIGSLLLDEIRVLLEKGF